MTLFKQINQLIQKDQNLIFLSKFHIYIPMKSAQKQIEQIKSTPRSSVLPKVINVEKVSFKQLRKDLPNKENSFLIVNHHKKLNSARLYLQKTCPQEKQEQLQNDHSEILYFSNQIRKICISKQDADKKQNIPYNITRIMANGRVSAASDNQGNVWLLGVTFPYPINLSQVIRQKIIDAFLGQKGIILKSKRKFYVINWDKIVLPKQTLRKKQIQNKFEELFECWQEVIPYRADAWYLFSLKTDSFVQTIYYQIYSQDLIVFPNFHKIKIGNKIKGLSVSKTHALCWTQCGKIYSWGQKSIALGYTDFEQDIKQRRIEKVDFQVVFAIAGTHYSIALSSEGQLYQWGIKSIWNQKTNSLTEQFIFLPRKLEVKFKGESQKICCLKGNQDHFGIITLSGNFYVWGKRIPRKLIQFNGVYKPESQTIQTHSQNTIQSNENLLYPTLCKCSQNVKIIDFQMRQEYVFLVKAHKMSKIKNKLCQQFWFQRVKSITSRIQSNRITRKHTPNFGTFISTDDQIITMATAKKQIANQSSYIKIKRHRRHQSAQQFQTQSPQQKPTQKQAFKFNHKLFGCDDKIAKAINQRLSKQEYFRSIHDQQKMLNNIMKSSSKITLVKRSVKISTLSSMVPRNDEVSYVKLQKNSRNKASGLRHSEGDLGEKIKLKLQKKRNKQGIQNVTVSNMMANDHAKMQYLLKNPPIYIQKRIKSNTHKLALRNQHIIQTTNSISTKQNSQLYNIKLNQILSRRQSLNHDFFKSTIEKIQKTSIQSRKKHSQETAARKQTQQKHRMLKQSLFRYLSKAYIVKGLMDTVSQGREIKIKAFVRNLKCTKIEKSVKRLFTTTRIKFDAHVLKQYMPKSYLKLVIIFRNFARKWKQDKRNRLIKFCVDKVMRINLKNKLKAGLLNAKISTKNLQKIGTWLQITKKQKIKCLNIIWKRQLLGIFKVHPQYQTQYNALNLKSQTKTFKQLYRQKVRNNPMLKIDNYLGLSPLFKVKMLKNCQQELLQLMLKKNDQIQMNFITSGNAGSMKKASSKHKIKIRQDQEQKFDLCYSVLSQNYFLLPYSKHFGIFIKPKELEINMNQNVKQSQKWAQQDKKILTRILTKIIESDRLQYEQKVHKYRQQMAMFIRDNYSKICQRRWKYIIEYNKLKNRDQKWVQKKQKQLIRFLSTIGCQSILNSDILPEKHRILDQAKQIRGAPQLPQKWVAFGPNKLKRAFKQYLQALRNRDKTFKKIKNNHPV